MRTDTHPRENHIGNIAQVREMVIDILKPLEELCTIAPAEAAFYFFLKVHTSMDAFELVKKLICEHKVAVIPATTFGMEDGCYLRVAYGALQKDTAQQGMERLVRGLQTIFP